MQEGRKKRRLLFLVFGLLILDMFLIRSDLSGLPSLTLGMLDVGQGDSIFIQSPSGVQVLFDGGAAHKSIGPLAKFMPPFDKTIDAVVITNPDADHIGGLADILSRYAVGAVLEPGTLNDAKAFKNLKDEIRRKNIPDILARRGMKMDLGGGAIIEILFPDRDVRTWATNDGSVVARLSYGGTSVMLTGDATKETEDIILRENAAKKLRSTVLKAGHHGSRTSSSYAFVNTLSPKYALVSDGRDNKYGHPHEEAMNIISGVGSKIFRTDILGSIIMISDGTKESFSFRK